MLLQLKAFPKCSTIFILEGEACTYTNSHAYGISILTALCASGMGGWHAPISCACHVTKMVTLAESSTSSQMYLTLASGRGGSSEYRKDQLWVVGSAPELALAAQTGISDRLNRPWCMVVRSCWHGPNHEGRRA